MHRLQDLSAGPAQPPVLRSAGPRLEATVLPHNARAHHLNACGHVGKFTEEKTCQRSVEVTPRSDVLNTQQIASFLPATGTRMCTTSLLLFVFHPITCSPCATMWSHSKSESKFSTRNTRGPSGALLITVKLSSATSLDCCPGDSQNPAEDSTYVSVDEGGGGGRERRGRRGKGTNKNNKK